MKYIINENQYRLLIEAGLPSFMTKFFGAQTAQKMNRILVDDLGKIESFFAAIAQAEKIVVTKAGQHYFRSNIGVEVPAQTIKTLLDMAMIGKITKENIDQYVNLLPEKFIQGSDFRRNIKNLLTITINKFESGASKNVSQNVGKQTQKATQSSNVAAANVAKTNFTMANPEESGKLAVWFDQKFYESGNKRHDSISNVQFEKLLPETKEYLKVLYKRLQEIMPNNPNSRMTIKNDQDIINAVTNNYWGGFGRYGELTNKHLNKQSVPSLPKPTKSVEDNLNSVFPSSSNGIKGNYWSSSN